MNVWYSSYGSNLLEERFLAYIFGRKVSGVDRSESGCRDKTAPKKSERVDIPYPLYFSKEKTKWGEGGVAFIDANQKAKENTIGRMYLITAEQFYDVVAQENDGLRYDFDLQQVEKDGFIDIHNGWYNRVVFLGRKDGAPIFTFTSSQKMDEIVLKKPSAAYLSVIAKGLKELGLMNEEITEYLLKQKGIEGELTTDSLERYIQLK